MKFKVILLCLSKLFILTYSLMSMGGVISHYLCYKYAMGAQSIENYLFIKECKLLCLDEFVH